ncbi:hypothetical protein AKJ09_03654 [Labilithrix luteola]|uniref:Uncharacterized protein n=1 Tax=Labilithrix luteola TaxID=1391654 RepID=A0A0K1PTX9_9BACT|nr:hypothetical protein AKJ09_03654 [Labilithrix luteola]
MTALRSAAQKALASAHAGKRTALRECIEALELALELVAEGEPAKTKAGR